MTLDRARELITTQIQFGSGYNRNSIRVLLAEIQREHGQQGVDQLITEFALDESLGLKIGREIKI